MAFKH
ncbi:hypothetical protein ECFRIK1990_1250, partial [Escherichia coli FRIK1990]